MPKRDQSPIQPKRPPAAPETAFGDDIRERLRHLTGVLAGLKYASAIAVPLVIGLAVWLGFDYSAMRTTYAQLQQDAPKLKATLDEIRRAPQDLITQPLVASLLASSEYRESSHVLLSESVFPRIDALEKSANELTSSRVHFARGFEEHKWADDDQMLLSSTFLQRSDRDRFTAPKTGWYLLRLRVTLTMDNDPAGELADGGSDVPLNIECMAAHKVEAPQSFLPLEMTGLSPLLLLKRDESAPNLGNRYAEKMLLIRLDEGDMLAIHASGKRIPSKCINYDATLVLL